MKKLASIISLDLGFSSIRTTYTTDMHVQQNILNLNLSMVDIYNHLENTMIQECKT